MLETGLSLIKTVSTRKPFCGDGQAGAAGLRLRRSGAYLANTVLPVAGLNALGLEHLTFIYNGTIE